MFKALPPNFIQIYQSAEITKHVEALCIVSRRMRNEL
jgi:hypothetical protein